MDYYNYSTVRSEQLHAIALTTDSMEHVRYTPHIFCDVVPMLPYIIIYLMVMYATASIYFKFMFLLHTSSDGTSHR